MKSWPQQVLPQKSGRLLHCLVEIKTRFVTVMCTYHGFHPVVPFLIAQALQLRLAIFGEEGLSEIHCFPKICIIRLCTTLVTRPPFFSQAAFMPLGCPPGNPEEEHVQKRHGFDLSCFEIDKTDIDVSSCSQTLHAQMHWVVWD